MSNQLQRVLFLTGLLSGLSTYPVWAQVDQGIGNRQQEGNREESYQFSGLSSGLDASAQTSTLVAQTSPAQITGIQLNSTSAGLEILLETTGGESTLVQSSRSGQRFVAEISNAQLVLPGTDRFRQNNPTAEITSVSATPLDGNRVQIIVTGTTAAPTGQVFLRQGRGLVVQTAIPAETTQQSTPTSSVDKEAPLELVVTAERETEGYQVEAATTATGTDTPLKDIPQSIQVVPQEVIEDRNVVELGEALETVGGVVEAGGRGTSVFGPNFLIRGFDVEKSIFRDGIPYFSLAPLSTNDIERVEVLKGPASVLFGQGEPGGIVNLISKQPLAEPFYEASFTAGSFDTYRGALDLSGPLNDSESVKYRLNVSYDNFGSFRDFVDGESLIISPMLTWEIGSKTSIDFYGQYTKDRETIDDGLVAFRDGIVDVPRSRFLGEPFSEFEQEQFNLGYRLNHQFSEDWSVRQSLQYTQYSPKRFAPLFDSFDEETGELSRLAYFAGGEYNRLFTNAEVLGKFNTGSVKHQVLAGVEYRRVAENPEFQFNDLFTSINVFDPVYTRTPYEIDPTFFRDDLINTIGMYVQDQIELLPNLKVLAGVRYDSADQFRTTQDVGEPRNEFEQTDSKFSPRLGVVYQPIEPVSLYGSYTTSFNPAFGASRNPDDSTFEPETGQQLEVGVKADVLDQLSLTLAAFDIRKQNVETPDPDDPLFSVQTGEVASRGIELNLGGEILPGWKMTAAYTYLDAFVSEDNTDDIVGNQLANAPNNQFSLWSTYEIQQGNLNGLGFGLGLFYVGDRPGDLENSFTLPSYFRTDAALFYKRDNLRAQLNIRNLFDVEYFTSASFGSRLGVNPGAPLTVLGTLTVEF